MFKQSKGITLVALVITVIVLLILAGVSINFMFGNEGIIGKAQRAVDMYKNAKNDEEVQIAKYSNQIDSYLENSRNITTAKLWTNSSPTSAFSAQKIDLNLSEYEYVVVVTTTSTMLDMKPRSASILKVTENAPNEGYEQKISASGTRSLREAYALKTGVMIFDTVNNNNGNDVVIPLYIYGIKGDFSIDDI